MVKYLGRFLELTAPAEEPVSVDEFKRDARFASGDFDADLIPLRLKDARDHFESQTLIATVERDFTFRLEHFPCTRLIEIGMVPLVSVDEIRYYDQDGTLQTLDSSTYIVDTWSRPGRIQLKATESWPQTDDRINAVEIDFTAGTADTTEGVPADIKTALIWIAKDRFYQPGPLSADTQAKIDSLRWKVMF